MGVGGLLIVALIAAGALLTLSRGGGSPAAAQTATAPPASISLAPAQTNANAPLASATNPLATSPTAPSPSAVNAAGTISTDGTPVGVKIATAGQKTRLTFAGTAGQAVAVQASKATFQSCGTTVAILKPDDAPLGSPQSICGGAGFLDPQTLPASGTFTLLVSPDGTTTGQVTLAAYVVVDATGTIVPDGAPVDITITTPGQRARYTFSGKSDQIVTVQASKGAFEGCGTTISILKPDESRLGSPQAICGGGGFLDQLSLPTDGSYTLLVDPDGATTGTATVMMYTVTDVTGTIAAGGPPVTVKTSTPGQNARYTFTGTSGQIVAVQASKGVVRGVRHDDRHPQARRVAARLAAGDLRRQRLPRSTEFAGGWFLHLARGSRRGDDGWGDPDPLHGGRCDGRHHTGWPAGRASKRRRRGKTRATPSRARVGRP